MNKLQEIISAKGRKRLCGVPEGADALLLRELLDASANNATILHVVRDDKRMSQLAEALAFFAGEVEVLTLPAWDCLPYDRVSPIAEVTARRVETLTTLAEDIEPASGQGRIVLATAAAVMQRVPRVDVMRDGKLTFKSGQEHSRADLTGYFDRMGYNRAEQVMEPGDYAVRGDIVDIFAPGMKEPVRLDFFGDEIESIRRFDVETQRTVGRINEIALLPVGEVFLDQESISRFRSGYRELFGVVSQTDPLYESISNGLKYGGMEHWLPLFHDGMDTVFAYLPDVTVSFDHQYGEVIENRLEMIDDYYQARLNIKGGGLSGDNVYKPVPPERLYLDQAEFDRMLNERTVLELSPYYEEESAERAVFDMGARPGRDFGDVRARADTNLYDELRDFISAQREKNQQVVIAAYSDGSRDRMVSVLREHGVAKVVTAECWEDITDDLTPEQLAVVILDLEHGFRREGLWVLSEQDILGDRMSRPGGRRRKAENFLREASEISEGDLVVHLDHGIGRYLGLRTVTAGGAPHDCLELEYDGGDKLFVPVENIEVLSRYGSDEGVSILDKLGGVAWQARKAKLRERIRDMAGKLIKVAAERHLRKGAALTAPEGSYDEFCASFPFAETEDQARAIRDTLDDLAAGKPMDRLVCGDVGFGKTEVALRAAFAAVMSGKQVAIVAPTTLLCRQHYLTFKQRFDGLPVRVEQLSRLVTGKNAKLVKDNLESGHVDIVCGTHALLGNGVKFKDLGLLIIDEEQHFGVKHKERLKELKTDVHVLTLTATPIPRTLQLALTGVKELSIIATPPVDRLAVRTYITPYDPVVVREAILRERHRGGQIFYVCPRVNELGRVAKELETLVPEIKFDVAHGQMGARDLEQVMTDFTDRKFDLLLATNIIESGIDVPNANTMIIHRADMFGLAQLYQLRGRIGRSKQRAYAYLTLPNGKKLTATALKRLEVMQTLDSLGAGFNLASHDLDIRGAGNLLGEEQSGHIKEVGIELYQQMIEEAVAEAKGEIEADDVASFVPQINVGMPVLIPDRYVPDLGVRLGLYRRISELRSREEVDQFAAEMIDRFGKLPKEVENLLDVVTIKQWCRTSNVEKLDAGPKGALITLRNNEFPNPAGLVGFIQQQVGVARLRPDHKIVYAAGWDGPTDRLEGLKRLMRRLADIAAKA
ncbi:transcription-repair coupling factor [Thalassospira xianhensis]|uniref:Transcription-repair-coupling factor n=1 Tax=Thalassospira xianhensis MCCC 1A02616 TaxID=1177929 RepID=A0A367UCW0_9PROT|nr:transcription-repair coupling factor [Thalassospira xianhensis]RCK05820.1 transcription-repair coupling factor [Thalassospira xianhensis MCCC 1A02616]